MGGDLTVPDSILKKATPLLRYIPYFSSHSMVYCRRVSAKEQQNGSFVFGYPEYEREFLEFIDEVENIDIMDCSYPETIKKKTGQTDYRKALPEIERADIELTLALLTAMIRHEHFCNGAWDIAAKNGWFLSVLNRLKELC